MRYALLFQNSQDRAFWMGCFALAHELRSACMRQLEAGLTQVKLGWWRTALIQSKREKAQHPVILAIGPENVNAVEDAQWQDLIEQLANGCEIKRHHDLEQWHATVRGELLPWQALVQAKSGFEPHTLKHLTQFWTCSTQICQLLRLAKYLDEGFQPVPVDWLSRFDVKAEQIKQRHNEPNAQALFDALSKELVQQANWAWQQMPVKQKLFARPLRALFRMRVAELDLHRRDTWPLLSEQKSLTPFKKFTVSWTTHVLRR